MIYIFVLAVVIIVVTCIFIYLRKRHVVKKRKERACKKCHGPTVRRHQMIDASSNHPPKWYGRFYLTRTLNDCEDKVCGHAECVKKGSVKLFRWDQLALRHIWDPGQFTPDEDLLKRAGLIDTAVEPLSERMMQEEVRQKKLRIPTVTPPDELSAHRRRPPTVALPVALIRVGTRKPPT